MTWPYAPPPPIFPCLLNVLLAQYYLQACGTNAPGYLENPRQVTHVEEVVELGRCW